jgi:carbamoyltransferase
VSGLSAYGDILPELLSKFIAMESWVSKVSISFDRGINARGKPTFQGANNDNFSFIKYVNPSPGPSNLASELSKHRVEDVAATAEEYLASRLLEITNRLFTKFGIAKPIRLGIAGGIFNNVRLNRIIAEHPLICSLHTTFAPGDSGLALGGALYQMNGTQKRHFVDNPYLGPSFNDDEILEVTNSHNLCYEKSENIEAVVAKLISEERIVGWFQGRGEYGPRSLGPRSILAHPNSPLSKEKVNHFVKKRDWFMPFAPAVIEEYVGILTDSQELVSPYMQVAVETKTIARSLIKSGVHVDGTARIQLVREKYNQRFYKLIREFEAITGIGAILNTSFNRHGIATISTPRQAIEHLMEGCVDYLILSNFIISYSSNRTALPLSYSELSKENSVEGLKELNFKLTKMRSSRECLEE